MPDGPCAPINDGELALFNGAVRVLYRYTWDGVSTRFGPDGCTGPVTRLQGINTTTNRTFYAHFKGRRGTPRVLEMPPGFNQTISNRQQLINAGFDQATDLENLQITESLVPPANVIRR